jgi:hypothetical protein
MQIHMRPYAVMARKGRSRKGRIDFNCCGLAWSHGRIHLLSRRRLILPSSVPGILIYCAFPLHQHQPSFLLPPSPSPFRSLGSRPRPRPVVSFFKKNLDPSFQCLALALARRWSAVAIILDGQGRTQVLQALSM